MTPAIDYEPRQMPFYGSAELIKHFEEQKLEKSFNMSQIYLYKYM